MTTPLRVYRDEAVVLRTWKLGEADRIVSLHTQGEGKVRCVAKGVRRTRSKFGAQLEPAGHVAVQIYRGKGDLDTITQTETITRFPSLWNDPDRFARASAMLEVVERLSPEREPNVDRHVMLVRALATLDRVSSPLVLAGFFLKLLMLEGVQPVLDRCVACDAEQYLDFIDVSEGGVMCQTCAAMRLDAIENSVLQSAGGYRVAHDVGAGGYRVSQGPASLKPGVLCLMRMIFGGRLAAVLRHPVDAVALDVVEIASQAMETHIEKRLRSITVLGV